MNANAVQQQNFEQQINQMQMLMENRSKQDKFYNIAKRQMNVVSGLEKRLDKEKKKLAKCIESFNNASISSDKAEKQGKKSENLEA